MARRTARFIGSGLAKENVRYRVPHGRLSDGVGLGVEFERNLISHLSGDRVGGEGQATVHDWRSAVSATHPHQELEIRTPSRQGRCVEQQKPAGC